MMRIGRKPVLEANTRIFNSKSGFKPKLLCDGPTFSAGTACAYTCAYCFVPEMVGTKLFVTDLLKGRAFQGVVIRRTNAAVRLREQLRSCRSLKDKHLVIYGSPLVDVAATMELVRETIDLCCVILEETQWTIRLLSKSPLLVFVAQGIPAQSKDRVIYGLSTGTLDDTVTRAIELGTPLVSKRLEALKQLQAEGFRTFAMLCPVLPLAGRGEENAAAANAFVAAAGKVIDFKACEHVWAEPINQKSAKENGTFDRVVAALGKAEQQALADSQPEKGTMLRQAAARIEAVRDKAAWEEYARALFRALAKALPPGKLRFLQYPTDATAPWWIARKSQGAIPLRPGGESEGPAAEIAAELETRKSAGVVEVNKTMTMQEVARLKSGDRIRMVAMPEDKDPIPVGTIGVVDSVVSVMGDVQINMESWENGRHLNPIVPPDEVERA
jgi:DNA repair photolyase